MAQKLVKSLKIKLENDFIYFLNNKGHLCKVSKLSVPGKKLKILTVKKLNIQRKPGYTYFLNQKGDLVKVFLDEGSKLRFKSKKKISKIKKKLKRKG